MGKLILVSGDIIENSKDVEAIVNPTNKYMDYGAGVCGAIYDKAGIEQLENYCHNKWDKDMEVNEIRITTGFALLKDIMDSSFIPFSSPHPSSTEEDLKKTIIEAARMIDKAMYLCGQLGYNNPVTNVV